MAARLVHGSFFGTAILLCLATTKANASASSALPLLQDTKRLQAPLFPLISKEDTNANVVLGAALPPVTHVLSSPSKTTSEGPRQLTVNAIQASTSGKSTYKASKSTGYRRSKKSDFNPKDCNRLKKSKHFQDQPTLCTQHAFPSLMAPQETTTLHPTGGNVDQIVVAPTIYPTMGDLEEDTEGPTFAPSEEDDDFIDENSDQGDDVLPVFSSETTFSSYSTGTSTTEATSSTAAETTAMDTSTSDLITMKQETSDLTRPPDVTVNAQPTTTTTSSTLIATQTSSSIASEGSLTVSSEESTIMATSANDSSIATTHVSSIEETSSVLLPLESTTLSTSAVQSSSNLDTTLEPSMPAASTLDSTESFSTSETPTSTLEKSSSSQSTTTATTTVPPPEATEQQQQQDAEVEEVWVNAVLEKCGMGVQDRSVKLRGIAQSISQDTKLDDSSSPAFAALQWLVQKDMRMLCPGQDTDEAILHRYAMATFYFGTNGVQWRTCSADAASSPCDNENWRWLNMEHECEWFGVACHQDSGDVKTILSLSLPDNNLVGSLVPELFSLTSLQGLTLGHNLLEGSIPREIAHLTKLEHLDLDYNHLSGEFPHVYYLSHLQAIDLNHNELSGPISNELGFLTNLVLLQLDNNKFSGPVPQIGLGQSSRLTYLSLNGNFLTGSLEALCSLVPSRRGSYSGYLQFFLADCYAEEDDDDEPKEHTIQCSCCSSCFTSLAE